MAGPMARAEEHTALMCGATPAGGTKATPAADNAGERSNQCPHRVEDTEDSDDEEGPEALRQRPPRGSAAAVAARCAALCKAQADPLDCRAVRNAPSQDAIKALRQQYRGTARCEASPACSEASPQPWARGLAGQGLEAAWEEAAARNREAAARPSPWQLAASDPNISYEDAWQQLVVGLPNVPADSAADVCGLDAAPALELQQLLGLARATLRNDEVLHLRLLQSVWRRLAASSDTPPRVGSHWECIGFQGDDPSTDLRGVGLLGLLHLLALAERDPAGLDAGLAASRHPSRHFPFAVASFNFSKLAMDLLLEGKLITACNRACGAEQPVVSLYVGVFRKFLTRWQAEQLSILDFGRVLKELSAQAAKSPQQFMRRGDAAR